MDKLANNPKFQAFDSNGDPLSGGKLYTYEVGTTTNKTTYSDRILSTANANPVVLDSRGECVVYFSGTIKFVLKTSADVEVWTMDNVAIDDAITSLLGFGIRANFTWKDADEIYINPGVYEINGKIVKWDSQLTSDIGSPDTSDWYYLYLDDSAIGTASKTLTASDFIWSNTEPAWSNAKHGWYNGEDKCIFAVRTDGSSNILEFFHDGGRFVEYDAYIADMSLTDIDTTFIDVTLTIPNFGDDAQALVNILAQYIAGGGLIYYRKNGSAATDNQVGEVEDGTTRSHNATKVTVDSAQKIEVAMQAAGTSKMGAFTVGYFLPAGM